LAAVAALLCLAVGIGAGGSAYGSEEDKMTRADNAAILFSNRFSFTKSGEPVMSVAVMDGQKTVRFSTKGVLTVSPSGPGGPSVRYANGGSFEVRLLEGTAAELGYRVRLGMHATKEFAAIKETLALWGQRGIEVESRELGTVFSFEGTVFDTRKTLIVTKRVWGARSQALEEGKRLEQRFSGTFQVEEELLGRPHGEMVMVHKGSGTEIRGRNALWFEPENGELIVNDVEFGRGFAWHGRETRRYAGAFYTAIDRHGAIALVNVLSAERLLKGLVPSEIYADSPKEALKAQAITARSELFAKLGHRHLADPYHLCSEQHCQVYKGLGAELPQTNRAVDDTRGKVVFSSKGGVADTRYHSTCGGHTEHGWLVWPGIDAEELVGRRELGKEAQVGPDEKAVRKFIEDPPESFCGRSPRSKSTFRWVETLKSGVVDDAAAKLGLGGVTSIEIVERGVSGRVVKLKIHDGTGKSASIDGELTIRRFFGGLKSSMFVVDAVAGTGGKITAWRFHGGGFGHGAGMCQNGAAEMARAGRSCDEILKHYYKGVSIQRIYR